MGEDNKTYTMAFKIDPETVQTITGEDEDDDLLAEIERLKRELDRIRSEREQAQHRAEIRYRDGIIEGLKFSVRCNGVSGGEVR